MNNSLQQTTEAIPVWNAWKRGEIDADERDARLAAIECEHPNVKESCIDGIDIAWCPDCGEVEA